MDHELIKFSSLTSAIIIGLIIGLRHSTDGDHIIAISTLAKEYKNIFKSLWIGVSWGLGHSTPLMILGVLILISKQAMMDIYNSISVYFEFGVAIMLVILGIQVFWKIYKGDFHTHSHEHDGLGHTHVHGSHQHDNENNNEHFHKKHGFFPELIPFFRVKSYVIGLIHGLAGSAAVMLAILPTTPNISTGIMFLLFFSIGTMISMSIMTIIMSIPFVFTESNRFTNPIISIFGILSIVLGVALGSDIAIGTNFTEFLWY
tara:strand:+ start:1896 stop:2672 length:777 start_codon:yes stop_codon:yes gene_type:complete